MEHTEEYSKSKEIITSIALFMITIFCTICQVGEYSFPTVHLNVNVVVGCITVILILNMTFNRDIIGGIRFFRLDIISRILLISFIYMTIISFIYGVEEYFADYYSSIFAILMYVWILNKKINKRIYLRTIEAFLTIIYVQILIISIDGITSGIQLYLLKSRIITPLGASNYLTTFMILFLPSIYKLEKNRIRKNIYVYGMFIIILLTRSNSGIAVYGMAIAVLLLSEKKYKMLRLIGVLVAGITVIWFIMARMPEYMDRFTNTFSAFFGRESGYTMNGRQIIYQTALSLIKEKPIIGYGVGYRGLNIILQLHTHNWILEYLLRGGCLYLIIECVAYINIIRTAKNRVLDLVSRQLVYITLAIVLVQGLVEPSLGALYFELFFWFVMGVLLQDNNEETPICT